ncbi:unnamed protein product, partial [marine sediment metagenome]
HKQISEKIGKARSTITEIISISKIPKKIRNLCEEFSIKSRGTIIEIAKQENEDNMYRLITEVKKRELKREDKCHELNYAAAQLVSDVKPEEKFAAGSMGPTGKFLKPHGEYTEEEFEEAYALQAKALTEGGVDFLLIETQYDLKEALCALRGARKSSNLPVFVTMTFNRNPRGYFTIMGNSVAQCVEELEAQDVPAIGTNCTLNSADMVDLLKIMRDATPLPLIAQANAGQPSLSSDGKVTYSQEVEDYVKYIP